MSRRWIKKARDSRIGVDIGVGVGLRACAVKGERREGVAADLGVVGGNGGVACGGVGAEPGGVASRRRGVGGGVRARSGGVGLCSGRGSDERSLLCGGAADVGRAAGERGSGAGGRRACRKRARSAPRSRRRASRWSSRR